MKWKRQIINDELFDDSIEYGEEFYVLEYEALTNKCKKLRENAMQCRAEYREKCRKCEIYLFIGIGMVCLYQLMNMGIFDYYKDVTESFGNLARFYQMYFKGIFGVPYLIFLIIKAWDMFINGEDKSSRWFAEKLDYVPLTLLAEEYDEKALFLENELKKVEEKREEKFGDL